MELVRAGEAVSLERGAVRSQQLLFPGNSCSARVTLTRVTVLPGHGNPLHIHAHAEQVWHVLSGTATLLLAEGGRQQVGPGDTVRFGDGEEHGASNAGTEPFAYLSVTSPPADFSESYASGWGVVEQPADSPARSP